MIARRGALFLVVLAVTCVACTETVPDFGIDLVHPFVARSEPLAAASNVDRDSPVRVVFSEPIDESTVTSDSFQVLLDGAPIAGTIATSSTAASFTPAERLNDLTSYELRLEESIRDRAGLALQAFYSANFTTEDLEWEPPFNVSVAANGPLLSGAAAIGPDGRVIVVWEADEGVLWGQQIVDSIPMEAIQIDSGPSLGGEVDVGFAEDGTALAIWSKSNGSRSDLFWSTWSPVSEMWSSPELLETDDAGTAGSSDLSMNAAGFAIAVWNQADTMTFPLRFNAYARAYTPVSGWGTLKNLENRSETAQPPYVAVGANGSAVTNWAQSDGSGTRLWGSYFDVVDGWTSPAVIETSGGVEFGLPHIDDSGTAMVVWGSFNRYLPDVGWEGPRPLPAGASFGTATLAGAGTGLLNWMEQNGGQTDVRVATISQEGDFGTPVLLASSSGAAYRVGCTLDDSGHGLTVWIAEIEGRQSLVSSRSLTSDIWSAPQLLESDDLGEVNSVHTVAVGPDGEVVVLYNRYDGVMSQVWAVLLR